MLRIKGSEVGKAIISNRDRWQTRFINEKSNCSVQAIRRIRQNLNKEKNVSDHLVNQILFQYYSAMQAIKLLIFFSLYKLEQHLKSTEFDADEKIKAEIKRWSPG